MFVENTYLHGVKIITPKIHEDSRGFFFETYNKKNVLQEIDFVQDNHSRSSKNVLRGLHFQRKPYGQGKLVRCTYGEIWDVAACIDPNSPNFKKWFGIFLSASNKKMLYIPEGYAHGFCVVSDTAELQYKCTNYYHPESDAGVAWNDPDLDIKWPVNNPILSEKDRELPFLHSPAFKI